MKDYTRTSVQNNMRSRQAYIAGNTVTKENVVEKMQQPYQTIDSRVARNRAKTKKLSFGYVLFMVAALALASTVLIGFIGVKSELTAATRNVASLESKLNDMRLSNDEELERIESSVNLEEIKRIAVEELGMTYAKSGQVVTISDEGSDYVRQMAELPKN